MTSPVQSSSSWAATSSEISTLVQALTGGELRFIDDANVLIMLDQPGQTAEAIGMFLIG